MIKKCSKCKKNKQSSSYNKNKLKKDGLQTTCKKCSQITSKQYYADHTDEHRIKTLARTRKRRKELKRRINEVKQRLGCSICNESNPCCLDFHHLHPNQKKFAIGAAPNLVERWEKIVEEIAKCVCICANCHRKTHAGEILLSEDLLCDGAL